MKQVSEQLSYTTVSIRWSLFSLPCCNYKVKIMIDYSQLSETVDWLGSFFMRQRIASVDAASFGLYPKWKTLVDFLCVFFDYLCSNLVKVVVSQVHSGARDAEQGKLPFSESAGEFDLLCVKVVFFLSYQRFMEQRP